MLKTAVLLRKIELEIGDTVDNYNLILADNKVEFFLKNTSKFEDKKSHLACVVSRNEELRAVTLSLVDRADFEYVIEDEGLFQFIIYSQVGNFMFDGRISRAYASEGDYYIDVRLTSSVEKASLRSSDRIECLMPVKYSTLQPGESYLDLPTELFEGMATNISGGGIRLSCNSSFKKKTKLRIIFEKFDGSLWIEASIVSVFLSTPNENNYAYEYGVQFITKKASRRKDVRFKCRVPVRYAVYDMSVLFAREFLPTSITLNAVSENISKGGIMIVGNVGLLKGTILNMVIERTDGTFAVQGIVVRDSIMMANSLFKTNIKYKDVN